MASGNERMAGLAAQLLARSAIVPDSDLQGPFIKAFVENNAKWIYLSCQYLPAVQNGWWNAFAGQSGAAFMQYLISLGAYTALDMTRDERWRVWAEYCAKAAIAPSRSGYPGQSFANHVANRPDMGTSWTQTTNEWYDYYWFEEAAGCSISSATGRISYTHSYNYTNGDRVVPMSIGGSGGALSIPSELTLGKEYEMANVTANTSFQLRDPDTGTIVSFATNYTGKTFGLLLQIAQTISPALRAVQASRGPDFFSDMNRAVVVTAYNHGHPDAALSMISVLDDLLSTTPVTNWATWNIAVAA
jgi:hypothetical protein